MKEPTHIIQPVILPIKDVPEGTLYFFPKRRVDETNEEYAKRCGVIRNLKITKKIKP